jgi:hypothetical protein
MIGRKDCAPTNAEVNYVSQSTMDSLFSPCTQLHDLLEEIQEYCNEYEYEFHDCNGETLMELNLNVSTEDFLALKGSFHTRTCTRC